MKDARFLFSRKRLNLRKRVRKIVWIALSLCFGWVLSIWISLGFAAGKPVDAVLVLGGSIQREIFVAQLAKQSPQVPILISYGSPDPCVRFVFEKLQAPIESVWLERCARSTFQNFCFSLPTLRRWNVHHVKLVTSQTHLPRAQWLGQILLGAHRIWMEVEVVPETGIPGNRESTVKTSLDITRSLAWAVTSQVYSPQCRNLKRLSEVEFSDRHALRCEDSQKFRELLK